MTSVKNFCSAPLFYECAVQPYEEGIKRLQRFWNGVDVHSLLREPLSLKDRMVSLVTGLFLMIPMVNMIVWIFWQTFGTPEILSDGLQGKGGTFTYTLPTLSPPEPITLSTSPELQQTVQETHTYLEKTQGKKPRTVAWTVTHHPSGEVETSKEGKEEGTVVVTSKAKFNANWNGLTFFQYEEGNNKGECTLSLSGGKRQLHVTGSQAGTRIDSTFFLEKDLPWLQQPTFGFQEFAKNKEKTSLPFYALIIHPWYTGAIEAEARKEGIETMSDGTSRLKIVLRPARTLFHRIGSMTLYFDPEKGDLLEVSTKVIFFSDTTTTRL